MYIKMKTREFLQCLMCISSSILPYVIIEQLPFLVVRRIDRQVINIPDGHQEVGRCGTRSGSQGMYSAFASAEANKTETQKSKQGYQWGTKIGHVYVPDKNILKKPSRWNNICGHASLDCCIMCQSLGAVVAKTTGNNMSASVVMTPSILLFL